VPLNFDDPMAGGTSGYYNPEFGLLAIQQPEMFAQHLASRGIQPPSDFPDDFDHRDAHMLLAQNTKDQSRAPGMGETNQPDPVTGQQPPASALPQQGNFEERFSDAFMGPPGSLRSYTDTSGRPIMPGANMPVPGPSDMAPKPTSPGPKAAYDAPEGDSRPSWFPRVGATENDPASRFGRWLRGEGTTDPGAPSKATEIPPEKPRREEKRVEPTPSSDSPATAGGSATPAGGTQEQPGDLNKQDPSAKAAASTEEKKEARKGNSDDAFGKALAGVAAMKPAPPVFPHPATPPHPSNQISRSTLPTELVKELSQIGRPGAANILRLGAALKGR